MAIQLNSFYSFPLSLLRTALLPLLLWAAPAAGAALFRRGVSSYYFMVSLLGKKRKWIFESLSHIGFSLQVVFTPEKLLRPVLICCWTFSHGSSVLITPLTLVWLFIFWNNFRLKVARTVRRAPIHTLLAFSNVTFHITILGFSAARN